MNINTMVSYHKQIACRHLCQKYFWPGLWHGRPCNFFSHLLYHAKFCSSVSYCVGACRTSQTRKFTIANRSHVSIFYFLVDPAKIFLASSSMLVSVAVWCSGNALVLINAVALHRARLVLGWVTAFG